MSPGFNVTFKGKSIGWYYTVDQARAAMQDVIDSAAREENDELLRSEVANGY